MPSELEIHLARTLADDHRHAPPRPVASFGGARRVARLTRLVRRRRPAGVEVR